MVSALNECLSLHPDNPRLAAFLKSQTINSTAPSSYSTNTQPTASPTPNGFAAQPSPSPVPNVTASGTSQNFNLMFPKDAFDFHIYSGVDFSFMGDLVNGLQNWANYEKQYSGVISVQDNFSQFGFVGGLEFKKTFEDQDFSINGEIVTGTGGEVDINNSNDTVGKVIINPTLLSLGFNYTRHFSVSRGIKPYWMIGLDYYQVSVQYSNPFPTNPNTSPSGYYGQGTFDANTWGGILGLGMECAIDRSFSFDILGRLRVATFGQLISSNFSGSAAPSGTGPYTLAIGNNNLYFVPVSYITAPNTPYRYAVLDYSGFDLMLGLHFYLGGDSKPAMR